MRSTQKRERLQHFETLCRQQGLSLTVQRRIIMETLLDRTDHPTADQVYEEVKPRIPGISRTTVYRVLETLVEIGVITKACSPGAATRYDPMTQKHHHLVCLRCDKLIDVIDEAIDESVLLPKVRTQQFEIQGYSVHFHGICAACRRELRAEPKPSTASADRDRKQGRKAKDSQPPKRRNKQ